MELKLPLTTKMPPALPGEGDVNYPTIFDASGEEIATIYTSYTDKDDVEIAQFIVRACNAHEQLVTALQDMVELTTPNIYPQPDKPKSAWAKLQAARAALTAAGAA
jgi:hypothetical protein